MDTPEAIVGLVTELLKSGGWIAASVFVGYLIYKTSLLGILTLAIYRSFKLIVVSLGSRTLQHRIAAEMGVKVPLTAGEEAAVLKAVRSIDITKL